jgi:hypothetical membrane protein
VILDNLIKNRRYIIITYIGVATFLIGSTFAMLIQPGYSFTDQWFSDLGTGKYGPLFNITLIMTGILSSTFYPITFYLLRSNGYSKLKSTIGMILGVTSFVFLILVGVFSLENNMYKIHTISAMMFLVTTSFAQIMLLSGFSWFICIHLASDPTMNNKISYTSFITAIMFGVVFVNDISFELHIMQKITFYLLLVTVVYQSMIIWKSEELIQSSLS